MKLAVSSGTERPGLSVSCDWEAGNSDRMRMVSVVVIGMLLWWGSALVSDTWQPAGGGNTDRARAEASLATAIARVEEASNRLDERVRSADVDEDLSNGWEDLRRDSMSVLREMARNPESQTVVGFAGRVEGFWKTYAPQAGLGPDTAEWRRFETAFNNAVGMWGSVASNVLTAGGS